MSGEWVKDCYDENYYSKSPPVDPECNNGSHRVYRGGSWYSEARCCRAANRAGHDPADRYSHLGFRLALVPSGS
jgi:formylglycine-generating enzyme required for sulfatase activity